MASCDRVLRRHSFSLDRMLACSPRVSRTATVVKGPCAQDIGSLNYFVKQNGMVLQPPADAVKARRLW